VSAFLEGSIVSLNPYFSLFYDKDPPGWLTWEKSVKLYMLPHSTKSTFSSWDPASQEIISVVIETTTQQKFWEKVSAYYAEENHETVIIQDNVSCVKSICMLSLLIIIITAHLSRSSAPRG